MADNVIYTYGGGEVLFAVLNAVAMICKSELSETLLKLMTVIAMSWVAVQSAIQQSIRPQLGWFAKYTIVIMLLIGPKSSVFVTDTVHNTRHKIDNLPIGLVLPASLSSTIGYGVTKLFEQAFSTVDANGLPYSRYGLGFGASLISQSKNFKIQDPLFRENMETFIDQCVMFDVMIGRKYSIVDMHASNSAWDLVKANASKIKMFNYRDKNQSSGRNLVTCAAGAVLLDGYWTSAIELLGKRFSGTNLSDDHQGKTKKPGEKKSDSMMSQALLANVQAVHQRFGHGKTAAETLKQLMFINAMSDVPATYGHMRARQQQQESWMLTGQLARENLPLLHSLFAAMIYTSFFMVLGMLVLPSGFRVFGTFLGLLIWIELWAPLFAVLSMIVDHASQNSGSVLKEGFTIQNISHVTAAQGNLASLAGYFMASIPYISYALIRGGAGQFVHLAGQLTGASQSAVTSAVQEVTSGNRSFDNSTIGTSSWNNSTANKTDLNPMTRMGHQEYQKSDGTLMRQTSGGATIFQAGQGLTMSTGARSMSMSDSESFQKQQAFSKESSFLQSSQAEYSTVQQRSFNKSGEFVMRAANMEASGQNYRFSNGFNDHSAFHNEVQRAKNLHHSFTQDSTKSQEYLHEKQNGMRSSLDANFSVGASRGAGSGVGASGSAGLTAEAGVFSQQSWHDNSSQNESVSRASGETKDIGTRMSQDEYIEMVVAAAKDMVFEEHQSEEKAMAQSLIASYEEQQALKESIAVQQQKVDSSRDSLERSLGSQWHQSDDLYHQELEWISKQKNPQGFAYGLHKAQEMMEHHDPAYENLHRTFVSRHVHQKMPNYFLSPDYQAQFEGQRDEMKKKNRIDDSNVEKASNMGIAISPISPHAKHKAEESMAGKEDAIKQKRQVLVAEGQEKQKIMDDKQNDSSFYDKIMENFGGKPKNKKEFDE